MKWTLVATTELDYGKEKKTREEKLARDKKFTDKIAAMPKMDDKNVNDILEADYKWFMDKKEKLNSMFLAYKEGRLRSKRLIELCKKGKHSLSLI